MFTIDSGNSAELSGDKSSVGGFSFFSIAEMAQPTLLRQYEAALQQQLSLVKQKIHLLSKPGATHKDSPVQLPRTSPVRDASESKILTRPTRNSTTSTTPEPLVPRPKSKYIVAAALSASAERSPLVDNRCIEGRTVEGQNLEIHQSSSGHKTCLRSPTGSESSLLPNQIEN